LPRHEVDEEEFNKFLEWKNTEKKKALIAAILSPERRDPSWGRMPRGDNPITVRQLFKQLPVGIIEQIEREFHPENNVVEPPQPATVTLEVDGGPRAWTIPTAPPRFDFAPGQVIRDNGDNF
jgi:hypothetical protein